MIATTFISIPLIPKSKECEIMHLFCHLYLWLSDKKIVVDKQQFTQYSERYSICCHVEAGRYTYKLLPLSNDKRERTEENGKREQLEEVSCLKHFFGNICSETWSRNWSTAFIINWKH